MVQIKGVVLDWAGTAVDFGCMAPVQAFVDTFAQWGLLISQTETRLPMGMAKRDHIEAILNMTRVHTLFTTKYGRDFNQDDIDQMYQFFEKILLQTLVLSKYACPKPYVLDTMAQLKERGIRIGSSTGYNKTMMDLVLPSAAKQGYQPEHWCCADHMAGFGRPYPYMIFNNMQVLALNDVRSVLKIGDTEIDIAEGKAAGVWTVAIIDGSSELGFSKSEWAQYSSDEKTAHRQRAHAAFTAYGADFIIQDMRELLGVIEVIEG